MYKYLIAIFSALVLSSCLSDVVQTKADRVVQQIETATSTIIPKPTKILESGIPDYFLNKTGTASSNECPSTSSMLTSIVFKV